MSPPLSEGLRGGRDRLGLEVAEGPQPARRGRSGVHVAVVGYGYWGSKQVRVLTSLPGVAVTVVDSDPARAQAASEQYPSATICADLAAALSSVDAVLVATPPGTHAQVCLQAIAAGKHVLVEKPMATSVADAESMVAAAGRRNVILMVGHTFLYNAAVQKLKEIVEAGDLGRILYVDSARLGLGRYQSDCNVIWDLAPHDISILAYLLNEFPRSVSVWAHRNVGGSHADLAYLQLGFERVRTNAFVRVSWLDPRRCRQATVVGERRMAVYDDTSDTDRLRIFDTGPDTTPNGLATHAWPVSFRRGNIRSPHIDFAEPLLVQAEHFLECIRLGREPLTPGTFGLEVVRVLDAADRARRHGGTVQLRNDARPSAAPVRPVVAAGSRPEGADQGCRAMAEAVGE